MVDIIAEIGINHQGSLSLAKEMIDECSRIGCDHVKFQKRTVDVVYTPEELGQQRESVFGSTNGDLKRGLEFDKEEYDEINRTCAAQGMSWFASPWDIESVQFLAAYSPWYIKLASASATDKDLLKACCETDIPLIISTGMCDLAKIHRIVSFVHQNKGEIGCLMHCTSTYPSAPEELNLKAISTLKIVFPTLKIGYSGHEDGVPTSIMAIALGAEMVERHVTLSRAMWGSDQSASLEMEGMRRLVSAARMWDKAKGDGQIKVYDSELPIIAKLRRKDDFL